jgi:hypothetical protein
MMSCIDRTGVSCVAAFVLLGTLHLACPFVVSAQPPDTLWSRVYDISPDIDQGKCVQQTNDGGLIITGSCVPNGMVSATDVLLLKTDALGHIQWTKTYDKGFVDEGLSVKQTFDGGYIIGGRALLVTGPIPTSNNQSQIWILKTDANGDTLWTKTYGGDGHDYCTSIQQTRDSGYIVAGTMDSKYSYPPNCFLDCNDYYSSRALLMRIDPEGDSLWSKTFTAGTYGNCVQQTSDGGYVMAGASLSGNQMDILIVKTNAIGHGVWTRIIGATDSLEFARCICTLPDGYVITGHAGPVPPGYIDALLMKTDLSGNVLWTRSYGGNLSDAGNSVGVASDGGLFITGITNATWYIHQGDIWAIRTDGQGTKRWERAYDIALSNYAWSGVQTSDDGYALAGMVSDGFGGDLWLAKLASEPTGIQDNPLDGADYVLCQNYPNPFNSQTIIRYITPQSGFVQLSVCDVLGREIARLVNEQQPSGLHKVEFESYGLASGMYFYQWQAGGHNETKKLILLR